MTSVPISSSRNVGLTVFDYTEKSIAVRGEHLDKYKEGLIALGCGTYHLNLRDGKGAGFTCPKSSRSRVEAFIKNIQSGKYVSASLPNTATADNKVELLTITVSGLLARLEKLESIVFNLNRQPPSFGNTGPPDYPKSTKTEEEAIDEVENEDSNEEVVVRPQSFLLKRPTALNLSNKKN